MCAAGKKSRHPDAIVAECRELIEQGYKEITLLGQNVNSYGKGLPEKVNFSELLRRIDAIGGDYRLRFMTSHPKDATHELVDTIAESRAHLPLHPPAVPVWQPCVKGDEPPLRPRKIPFDLIRYAKRENADLSLTSDIIVGFPGETYEEFLRDAEPHPRGGVHVALYVYFLAAPGTRAAEMEDPVTYKEKTQWFSEL